VLRATRTPVNLPAEAEGLAITPIPAMASRTRGTIFMPTMTGTSTRPAPVPGGSSMTVRVGEAGRAATARARRWIVGSPPEVWVTNAGVIFIPVAGEEDSVAAVGLTAVAGEAAGSMAFEVADFAARN
jgi:hypothetical protein